MGAGYTSGLEFAEKMSELVRRLQSNPNHLVCFNEQYEIALLVAHDAEAVERALLVLNHQDLLSDQEWPAAVSWLFDNCEHFDEQTWWRLRVATGVAAGATTGWQAVRELLGDDRLRGPRSVYGVDAWRTRTVLAAASSEHRELWNRLTVQVALGRASRWDRAPSLHATAARRRLEEHANEQPEVWAEAMPWLLAACKNSDGFLDSLLVAKVALGDRLFREAVESAAKHPHLAVRVPAEGVLARAGGVDEADLAGRLIEVLAAVLDDDRSRIEAFPRPLAEPTHTWLSHHRLEDLVRNGAALALNRFRDVVRNQGAAEEDALTTRLLDGLEREFAKIDAELALAEPRGAHRSEISLAQRPVRKADERTIGADVGLVVTVDLPGRLEVRLGELVQVKKSKLLYGTGGSTDSWRIDVAQLRNLLEHSPTAVYWLILNSGRVLCVPAKLLHAIVAGKGKSKVLTVPYSEVRHAAIGLEQYLRDLLIGMWVGNRGEPTLGVASGAHDRIRPMRILDIAVRGRGEREPREGRDR